MLNITIICTYLLLFNILLNLVIRHVHNQYSQWRHICLTLILIYGGEGIGCVVVFTILSVN